MRRGRSVQQKRGYAVWAYRYDVVNTRGVGREDAVHFITWNLSACSSSLLDTVSPWIGRYANTRFEREDSKIVLHLRGFT